jgi:L-threonate 2-dehydrogenase
MQKPVAVIAPGSMGSAVGRRLAQSGLVVLTSLAGRSEASAARAAAAGMRGVSDEALADAGIILSIVPPGDAQALAERLTPVLSAAAEKPVFVDCNAVNPVTVRRIASVIAPTGAQFVDAGIVGGPPQPGKPGPVFYASGPHAEAFTALVPAGLDVRVIGTEIGEASALKMSYAGITKGITALASAMLLAATRGGTAAALRAELADSQPKLLEMFSRGVPAMYPKAYRWVAEMEEIAGFVAEDEGARMIFEGAARLYARLAADQAGEQREIEALSAFFAAPAPASAAAE